MSLVREQGPDAPRLHCASLLGVTAALAAAFHFRAFRFRHALITIIHVTALDAYERPSNTCLLSVLTGPL